MTVDPLEITQDGVRQTISLLRGVGYRECVLLWLGRREAGIQRIVEVFRPTQRASVDYFEIPRDGMAQLMTRLRTQNLYVASQVHTHPGEAFHSAADDKWAIVRHHGALSIVLPKFAKTTTSDNFLAEAAVYQLSSLSEWIRVDVQTLPNVLRISS